ncbi:MAG: NADPH-dependent FMN reductase [Bacteroidetes bacterium]|nr:MAG: NADPH-dependent FMN reductase [Bacteroidota bacterium]
MEKFVIISGTNRDEALSPTVASSYAQLAKKAGIEAEIIDLRDLPHDFTISALYDKAGKHPEFNKLREKMTEANKFIFIVPEYNGSFPGVLKAFIDGLDFPETFTGKKAAMVGISAGMLGSSHAMSHLTDILNYCGTHVLARKPRFTQISRYLEDGKLVYEPYLSQLQKQIRELANF